MAQKIIFANIGWMISYNGQNLSDQIFGGGSYSDADKHEAFNFQDLNRKCYGYVQAKYDTINLSRIDSTVEDNSQKIEDVLVIWFAPNKILGGSWIVGWYRHATVYRNYKSSRSEARNKYGYYFVAKQEDCILLPVDERTMQIPRQRKYYPGRSNIWYADAPEVRAFRNKIVSYVNSYNPTNKKMRQNPFSKISTVARTQIEIAAVNKIKELYTQRGYIVIDVQKENKGWDLEAIMGKRKLLLEVKGQGNHSPYIRITRNEYEQMKKHKAIYRICVVINAIKSPESYIFLHQYNNIWVWEDDENTKLEIDEQIAAIATF